uniref:Uncharacterized protein n=1 Tax=Romanomermis culicivorax TaxID=13658 RepID=A0A915KT19_ROMCU
MMLHMFNPWPCSPLIFAWLKTFQEGDKTELNYGNDAKQMLCIGAGYTFDRGNIENIKENKRAIEGVKIIENSASVELMAPIHAGLFMQQQVLLNQCINLKIGPYRNKDEFGLQRYREDDNEKYKIRIKNMSFFKLKVEIDDNIDLALESMLLNTSAKYPLRSSIESSDLMVLFTVKPIDFKNLRKN